MRPVLILIFLCGAIPAIADEPCMNIVVETTGTPSTVLMNPHGWPFVEELQGVTIEIQLLDCENNPIPWYPPQDIWLDSFIPGEIALCPQGTHPVYGTDANGRTSFEGSRLAAGGFTTGGVTIVVAGQPALLDTPLPIQLVSADINGDLKVNLTDFSIFARDWKTDAARSDFDGDGIVDLPDFSHLGVVYDAGCR
jgi:hypothetical protein